MLCVNCTETEGEIEREAVESQNLLNYEIEVKCFYLLSFIVTSYLFFFLYLLAFIYLYVHEINSFSAESCVRSFIRALSFFFISRMHFIWYRENCVAMCGNERRICVTCWNMKRMKSRAI